MKRSVTLVHVFNAVVSVAALLFLCACVNLGGDVNHADSPPRELQTCHYKGDLRTAAGRIRYYAWLLGDGGTFRMEMTFTEAGETLQTLEYAYREDFDPRTLRYGVIAADADGDGADDLLLDMGIRGQGLSFACFVYDAQSGRYAVVPDFEELNLPKLISGEGAILASWEGGVDGIIYGASKYFIENGTLVLVMSLEKTSAMIDGQETWVYTEKRLINGVSSMVLDRVPLDSVKLDDWVGCELFWEGSAPEWYSTGPISLAKAIPVAQPDIQNIKNSGRVNANGRQLNYYAWITEFTADKYATEVLIIDAETGNEVQIVRYEHRESYEPESALRIVLQEDVTGDGSQDLLIDLGFNDVSSCACFMYDTEMEYYVYSPGYEKIVSPRVIAGQGVTLSRWDSGALQVADRYEFTGTEWKPMARLAVNPTSDEIHFDGHVYPPGFTEERTVAKIGVTANEIDHGYWYYERHVFRDL